MVYCCFAQLKVEHSDLFILYQTAICLSSIRRKIVHFAPQVCPADISAPICTKKCRYSKAMSANNCDLYTKIMGICHRTYPLRVIQLCRFPIQSFFFFSTTAAGMTAMSAAMPITEPQPPLF